MSPLTFSSVNHPTVYVYAIYVAKMHWYDKRSVAFFLDSIDGRDQSRAETNETKWCHICFHIFLEIKEQYRNRYCLKHIQTEYDVDTKW
jgi:hypothetical protein